MDRFFSLFQKAASCSKWNKIRLGPRFVRCPSRHHPWTSVVLIVFNDITTDTDSEIRLFVDDCVCYREIKGTEDTVELRRI